MPELLTDPSMWRLDTFLVPPGSLATGEVVLEGDEGHHAARVVRIRPGALARVTDGEGVEGIGRVTRVAPRAPCEAVLEVVELRAHKREDGTSLTIAQGLLKERSFDEVVRRCGELGVSEVVPVATARAQVRAPSRARLARWRAVAAAALKQSRGVFLTRVSDPLTFDALLDRVGSSPWACVAWEEERAAHLREALRTAAAPNGRRTAMLAVVGPEGGLTSEEVAALGRAGATAVTLGPRVLKADWAAAALAAAVACESGRLLP